MKKIISVVLAVMMLLSCFAGLSFNAFAADPPENGWYLDGDIWYYYEDGNPVEDDWRYINGAWYFFDYDGWMACNDWWNIDDAYYAFGSDGKMLKGGWVSLTYTYSDDESYTEWFYAANNGKLFEGWKSIGGKWYYLDPYMYVGICEINDKGYCFNESGAMITGWYKIDSSSMMPMSDDFSTMSIFTAYKSYYSSGWVYANGQGELQTGWKQINKVWYYFDEDSYMMRVGEVEIGDDTYYFNQDGAWVKNGWCEYYGTWCYIKNNVAQDGWQYINKKWYFFDDTRMVYGGYRIDGEDYFFDSTGAWVKNPANGWNSISVTATYPGMDQEITKTGWFYIQNGKLTTDWKKIGGKWYYFTGEDEYSLRGYEVEEEAYTGMVGLMEYSTTVESNGKFYALDKSGAMITKTGWNKLEAPDYYKTIYGDEAVAWVYVKNTAGELQTGWKSIGGKWYYFANYNARMVANDVYKVDGKYYAFDKSGALVTKAGWFAVTETYYSSYGSHTYTRWYYLNADGTCYRGWKQTGGKWYYLNDLYKYDSPYMFAGWYTIDGTEYYFDYETGALIDPEAPVIDN